MFFKKNSVHWNILIENDPVFISEYYGCVNWQPGNLAVSEKPESQEAKRKWMVEEYSKAQPDMPLVHIKIEETFPTSGTEINSGKDVTKIIDAWSFLKTAECIEEIL